MRDELGYCGRRAVGCESLSSDALFRGRRGSRGRNRAEAKTVLRGGGITRAFLVHTAVAVIEANNLEDLAGMDRGSIADTARDPVAFRLVLEVV